MSQILDSVYRSGMVVMTPADPKAKPGIMELFRRVKAGGGEVVELLDREGGSANAEARMDLICEMIEFAHSLELQCGPGTVRDPERAERFCRDAEPDFIISLAWSSSIALAAREGGVEYLGGISDQRGLQEAQEFGCRGVKIYHAAKQVPYDHLTSVWKPIVDSETVFVATGGVKLFMPGEVVRFPTTLFKEADARKDRFEYWVSLAVGRGVSVGVGSQFNEQVATNSDLSSVEAMVKVARGFIDQVRQG